MTNGGVEDENEEELLQEGVAVKMIKTFVNSGREENVDLALIVLMYINKVLGKFKFF